MNIRKVAIVISLVSLVACNNTQSSTAVEDPEFVFKKELKQIYSLYEDEAKTLIADMTEEKVGVLVENMLDVAGIEDASVLFGDSKVGIVRSEGKRINAQKMPVTINFDADEKSTKEFFNQVIALDTRVLINDIAISYLDEKYTSDCSFVFCGTEEQDDTLNMAQGVMTIEELSPHIEEQEDKIILRDNDLLMVIRPFNSDSAAISFGSSKDTLGSSYVYFNTNEKINFDINFTYENKKYYCSYNDINGNTIRTELNIDDKDILLDILSCKKEKQEDMIGINLVVTNNTDKKVSVKVFDDSSRRVTINVQGKNVGVEK
ncbi:MAG: hypothetical protein IJS47_01650 [Clostridia bacterium]|nr:hypothetical protein [Clostridia bacterium]